MTSTGFIPTDKTQMTDFDDAKNDENGCAFWNGKLNSGESAMSQTRVIKNTSGTVVGAVRYMVSMEPVNSRILLISAGIIAVGLVIIGLVVYRDFCLYAQL